jgi:hypothetical protein
MSSYRKSPKDYYSNFTVLRLKSCSSDPKIYLLFENLFLCFMVINILYISSMTYSKKVTKLVIQYHV